MSEILNWNETATADTKPAATKTPAVQQHATGLEQLEMGAARIKVDDKK